MVSVITLSVIKSLLLNNYYIRCVAPFWFYTESFKAMVSREPHTGSYAPFVSFTSPLTGHIRIAISSIKLINGAGNKELCRFIKPLKKEAIASPTLFMLSPFKIIF